MNDLRPLLDDDATALEAALLREAAREQPDAEALDRTLRKLGVAGAVVAAGAATAAVGLKSSFLAALLKGLALFFFVGLMASAMIHWRGPLFAWLGGRDTAVAPAAPTDPAKLASAESAPLPGGDDAASAAPPIAPAGSADASAIAPEETPLPRDSTSRSQSSATHAPAEATARPLAPEIALIDQARAAFKNNKPRVALALLDRYRHQFPSGRLAPEANYLRIEALMANGDRKAAEALGRKSLGDGGDSPHDKRIRAILETGSAPPPSP